MHAHSELAVAVDERLEVVRQAVLPTPIPITASAPMTASMTTPVPTAVQAQIPTEAPCGSIASAHMAVARINSARALGAVCTSTGAVQVAGPLTWSESLAAVASTQSREMAALRRMGHRDRRDRGLGERMRAVDDSFSLVVENVAVGYPSLDSVVAAWLESQGHCENLLDATVVEFGLACSGDSGSGEAAADHRYWSLVLGRPRRGGINAVQTSAVQANAVPAAPMLSSAQTTGK